MEEGELGWDYSDALPLLGSNISVSMRSPRKQSICLSGQKDSGLSGEPSLSMIFQSIRTFQDEVKMENRQARQA